MIEFRPLAFVRRSLVVFILLFPAPFFGGVGVLPISVLQGLIATAFFLMVFDRFLFKSDRPMSALRLFWFPILLFLGYLGYIWLQWTMGPLVFQGVIGSIAPYRTFDYAIQVSCYGMLFLLYLDLLSVFKRIEWVIGLLLLVMVFVMALGFYQVFQDRTPMMKFYGLFDPTNIQIFYSSFPNANHFGAFLWICSALLVAFVLHYWWYFEWPMQLDVRMVLSAIFAMTLLFVGWSIFCASAKAAFLTYIAMMAVMPYLLLPRLQRVPWLLIFFLLFGVLLGSISISRLSVYFNEWRLISQSILVRLSISSEMIGMVRDFPLFGVGLGTTKFISSLYQIKDVEHFTYYHLFNHHLELFADTGLLGYTLFLASAGLFVWIGLQGCRHAKVPANRIYGLCSLFAVGCLFFLCWIDEYLLTPAVAVVAVLHLAIVAHCAAISYEAEPEERRMPDPLAPLRKGLRWPTVLGTLVMCTALVLHSVKAGAAGLLIKPAECNVATLTKTVQLTPDNAEYLLLLGDACYRESKGGFVWAYEKAVRQAPTWSRAWLMLGRAKISQGKLEEGFDDLEQSALLMPFNRDSYLYVVLTALRLADKYEKGSPAYSFYWDKAKEWLLASKTLKKPLTREDHNYISMHAGPFALAKEDDKRILDLFDSLE